MIKAMNVQKLVFIGVFFLLGSQICFAQMNGANKVNKSSAQAVKSTPAYAEILLRKTELSAELENLLLGYTEEYPKVKELRFQSGLLQKDSEKLLAVSDASKLTLALGKLIVRRAELETDLWNLQRQYGDEHPNVKRARRKVEVFEQAIKEILP